jgi:threonine/homoserine/homoserine lactone efflux protein
VTLASFLSFCGVALAATLLPGPDFALVTRTALVDGRARGSAALPAIRRRLDRIGGSVLVAAGIWLALERR